MPTDRERIAHLEKEIERLDQMLTGAITKLNRVPDVLLLGPNNPAPGWIAELRPKE